ncbi:hypothetical protein FI667_g3862, partial [Globisporangium splendens]
MQPAKPTATPRGQRRHSELHRHATEIQAAFRGWRTRKRVVWDVRTEVDAFVAGVQQDLLVKQTLLGVSGGGAAASPLLLTSDVHWLLGGDRGRRLHLPRIHDNVFGVQVAFPAPISLRVGADESHDTSASIKQELQGDADRESDVVVTDLETSACDDKEESVGCAEGIQTAPDVDGAFPEEKVLAAHAESMAQSSLVLDDAAGTDGTVAVEPHQLYSQEPKEASAQGNSIVAADSASGLTVEAILATHSKEEILLELEWARQALRERRKVRLIRAFNVSCAGPLSKLILYLQSRRKRNN